MHQQREQTTGAVSDAYENTQTVGSSEGKLCTMFTGMENKPTADFGRAADQHKWTLRIFSFLKKF
jgi:hypothetical protein